MNKKARESVNSMLKVCEVEAEYALPRAVRFVEEEPQGTTYFGNLETRMVKIGTTLESSDNFQVSRSGDKPKVGGGDTKTVTK